MRNFEVGDRVECQAQKCSNCPRWDFGADLDTDGNGKWIHGVVCSTQGDVDFTVRFDDGLEWIWSQPSYNSERYSFPGYLRLIETMTNAVSAPSIQNNDGRDSCFSCGAKTRPCGGWSFTVDYRICTKCGR
jgi:hypothetical protein